MVDLATWVLVLGAGIGVFGLVFTVGAIAYLANIEDGHVRIAALLLGAGTMCAVFAIAVLHVYSARETQDLFGGF